ncbi:hypothetical protein [Mesorhizobium sp. B2-4-10]|nr:hypothetical protein [Mesorhizobium sp. B2-4-10]
MAGIEAADDPRRHPFPANWEVDASVFVGTHKGYDKIDPEKV